MLNKLQKKWGISGKRFFMVMVVFALTGTTAAWLTAEITGWLRIEKFSFAWWTLKVGMLLIGYQILLLFYGFVFGQFDFFWHYERKILSHMRLLPPQPEPARLMVFASGAGSNAEKLIQYFNENSQKSSIAKVTQIVCNKENAGVLKIAEKYDVPVMMIHKKELERGAYNEDWKKHGDWIILAGFLLKIPSSLVNTFPKRIVNLHPALLPLHGGRGMYGMRVHEAVLASGESETGITIHFVDDEYDHGETIFQARCTLQPNETPETLAQKIHQLEHLHYPEQIEKLVVNAKAALKNKK